MMRLDPFYPVVDNVDWVALLVKEGARLIQLRIKERSDETVLPDIDVEEGLTLMGACEPMAEMLGDKFVKAYLALKETEYEAFFRVISSWERRHLLLHV